MRRSVAQFAVVVCLTLAGVEARAGDLTLLAPNGGEVGNLAWLTAVPYDVTWTQATNVAGTVHLQHSSDGGATWREFAPAATNVAVSSGAYRWKTPSTVTTQALVRILHEGGILSDVSDAPFELREGLQIVQHNGGAPAWHLGETNRISWRRSFLASPAHVEFSADGAFGGEQVRLTALAMGTDTTNSFLWTIPLTNTALVSTAGVLRVIEQSQHYSDVSDAPFVLAGAVFTAPAAGASWPVAQSGVVSWVSAGMGPTARLDVQSLPSGTWVPVEDAVPNQEGTNSYAWRPPDGMVGQMRLRLQSNADPRAQGVSGAFGVLGAATTFVSEVGGHVWPHDTWSTAATNIHAALAAVRHDGTVWVSNGLYAVDRQVEVTNGVALRSVNGPDVTTIRGGYPAQTNRCVSIQGSNAVLCGFTLTNGASVWDGGGILALDGATVTNCMVAGNLAMQSGGGIRMNWGRVLDTRVSGNVSRGSGGGVDIGEFAWLIYPLNAKSGGRLRLLEGCTIQGNVATNGPGGVSCGTDVQVRRCEIRGNSGNVGGGLTGSNCQIEDSVIIGNRAWGAGGVYVMGSDVKRCVISSNEADIVGGIALDGGLLSSSVVHGNHASMLGGVGLEYGARMWSVVVAGNGADEGCAGLVMLAHLGDPGDVRNSIILGNGLPVDAQWVVDDTNMPAPIFATCTWPLPPGEGNITNDPQFVDAVAGDYRLAAESPCIDAGMALAGVTSDFAGLPRPLDGDHDGAARWDMGAFEFLHPEADSDGDGITDTNEWYSIGTQPTVADSDGDGQRDGDEVTADTNPLDAESALRIVRAESDPLGLRLDWVGGSAAWQFLEYRRELADTNTPWELLLGIPPPTPRFNAIIDAGDRDAAGYYRIRAERR